MVAYYKSLKHQPVSDVYHKRDGLYQIMMWYGGPPKNMEKRFSLPNQKKLLEFENTLLKGVSKSSLKRVYKQSILVNFKENDVILTEGSQALIVCLIATGRVKIVKHHKVINTLEQYDFMGEVSGVLKAGRSATVIAETDNTRVLFLSRNAISRVKKKSDQIRILKNIIM